MNKRDNEKKHVTDRLLVINIGQLATPHGKCARTGAEMSEISVSENVEIYVEDGIIRKIARKGELKEYLFKSDVKILDAGQKAVVPGFVDSHTHFVFSGYRAEEFIDRLRGIPYLELLRRGGGIQSTVKTTRKESEEELLRLGRMRIHEMIMQGVTTIEGKSGYGLDRECELKQLFVMKRLDAEEDMDIVTTYMGAHAVPVDYEGKEDQYIDFMRKEVLPVVREEGLAEYVDVFCEDSVYNICQSRRILSDAKELGFGLKIHADEIVPLGGAELAAELEAVSADHLLMISDKGIRALGKSGTVATLLPNTAFCMEKPYAPARQIIDGGAAVALASDYNPGSCFTGSVALMISLAAIHMHMSMEEVLTAITLNGAAALGRADTVGSVEEGKQADFLILDYDNWQFLVYHTGINIVNTVVKKGKVIVQKKI